MCARTHAHTHLYTHALPTTALETVSCPTASIFPKMIFSRNCFRETLSASSAWLWTWGQRDNRNQDQNTSMHYIINNLLMIQQLCRGIRRSSRVEWPSTAMSEAGQQPTFEWLRSR